jgi:hypothetical protein
LAPLQEDPLQALTLARDAAPKMQTGHAASNGHNRRQT